MISVENETSRAIALAAVGRLRSNFHIVAQFLEGPEKAIDAAERLRKENERNKIKSESGAIERHQAKITLLLGVNTSLALNQSLIDLADHVAQFKSLVAEEGDALLQRVLETGQKTEAWQAHIRNCLNVVKGTEKKILHPHGPSL